MLGLPKSTEFNKRIPKQKFYENIAVTTAMKKAFVEQIRIIYWRNKIAATTLNLAAGEQVTEIEVFEVRLSAPDLDESVLRQIDREVPYHILFLLEYEGRYRAAIGYKEAAAGKTAFKVDRYYYTDWLEADELPAAGNKVQLIGFGTFESVERAAREGRNPRTNETMTIAASRSPKFKPAAPFKQKLN